MRRLDHDKPFPSDLNQKVKDCKGSNIQTFQNEKQLLEVFISLLSKYDPDMLISHNLCGGIFELLLARIDFLKIVHWSRIGRFKRSQIPKKVDSGSSYGGSQWVPRLASCGRLLVDTFLSAKELVRETNYDLQHLT